jgi:hypothetical protein
MSDERRDVLHGLEGYTPGPWTEERPKASERHVIGRESGSDRLVLVAACETDTDARLIARAPELVEEVRELREGLREIAKAEGPYSRDPLEHASNCIEHMQRIARALLPDTPEDR